MAFWSMVGVCLVRKVMFFSVGLCRPITLLSQHPSPQHPSCDVQLRLGRHNLHSVFQLKSTFVQ